MMVELKQKMGPRGVRGKDGIVSELEPLGTTNVGDGVENRKRDPRGVGDKGRRCLWAQIPRHN